MRLPFYTLVAAMATLVPLYGAKAQTASSSSTAGAASQSSANAASLSAAAAIARSGNQSVNFHTPRQPGAIGMAGLAASAGCMGSTSFGLGVVGGSIGLGSTWQDQRCNAREDARLLASFGFRREALQLLMLNSPMVAQVMGGAPPVASAGPAVAYRPVSLNPDERLVNGIRQVYRNGPSGAPSEKCAATLGLLQQQDAYLRAQVSGRPKPNAKRNALLVQENLRQGIANAQIVCPAGIAKQVIDEVSGRIGQIDEFEASGRWTGPVG